MPISPRWAIALLLPLAACNSNSSAPFQATLPQPLPGAITASVQDQNFVQQAAASDMFEIESSKLALQKSRSPAIRAFAQRMIDDHTMSTQKIMALDQAKGIAPPPGMDPNQQRMLAQLQGARGGFDRAYASAQVTGHTAAVATFRTEIADGYDADVRGFAQETLPTIQGHLDMARRLAGR